MCHFVVGSTQLEAEDWLEIFSLEKDVTFHPVTEVERMGQGS